MKKSIYDIGITKGFLNRIRKALSINKKENNILTKLKLECQVIKKKEIKKPIEWEKIQIKHISRNGLISSIFKGFLQINKQKIDKPTEK
jgi:hypothetical protein